MFDGTDSVLINEFTLYAKFLISYCDHRNFDVFDTTKYLGVYFKINSLVHVNSGL
jgi:aminoglycoside N3'-acetyltransferase